MKLINQSRARLPVEDYSLALRKAVQWLGERYVLAVPVKPVTTTATDHDFFRETRSWNQPVRRPLVERRLSREIGRTQIALVAACDPPSGAPASPKS